jgi:hypothetical protein
LALEVVDLARIRRPLANEDYELDLRTVEFDQNVIGRGAGTGVGDSAESMYDFEELIKHYS